MRRLGLLAFGACFVILFVIVAIAEGIGHPSVPSGDVALVEGVPSDIGEISKADFRHALVQTAASAGEKKLPKPGDSKYKEIKEGALNRVIQPVWIQGVAEEMGFEATDKEIAQELKKLKKDSFKSEAEFKKSLKELHFNAKDVKQQVKLQILSKQVEEQLREDAPKPSKGEVENYYEAAKSSQFTEKPTRDVREVVNKDKKKAEAAYKALSKDNSAKNWKKVVKKYSEDPTTAEKGGLQEGLSEEFLQEPLKRDIFGADEGQLVGPVKYEKNYVVFEVVGISPESVQELKAVESQIQSQLAQQAEQEYVAGFVENFNTEWTQRTFCAPGYTIDICANFKPPAHPSTAPAGCYEANPKGGLPEACPAPVFQLVPALPGTVSLLEPKGKQLPQRPRPVEEEGEEASPTGLPEGFSVPPAE